MLGRTVKAWDVVLCLAACVRAATGTACTEMYEVVLKRPAGVKVTPEEVAGLYTRYCKKNMKVSSAKSMDELCAPLARKIEEKMRWVPPDADVTPELACSTIDKIKETFPEHLAAAEAELRLAGEKEAKVEQLRDKAKTLKTQLSGELKTLMGAFGEELVGRLHVRLREKTEEVLGAGFGTPPKEALVKQMQEAAGLSIRGVETKLLQKLDEAVGNWASQARKEAFAEASAEL